MTTGPFGRELRRLREQRRLSLQKFADLVNYSRGYIGKVEVGDKPPTGELARRCDEVLEAGGTLIALAAGEGLPRLAQLPAVPATFVGRETPLRQLTDELLREGAPGTPAVVAVDGPPGTGKTALALRLAHQVRSAFPDGQLYVDLHGYSPAEAPARPATVLEELLVALGQPADSIPPGPQQRAALYRSLLDGRKVLLVLDNARESGQVAPLLPGSAGCGVILTSRVRLTSLDMRQEQRLTLDPLTEHESVSLLRTVIGDPRADEEPQAVRDLADRCGHLPLALRIAAERVATHPHHAILTLVEELTDESERLDGLVTSDSLTVRAVFSWSYQDLGAAKARMFRLLGLHRGPHISTSAAAALAGLTTPQARRLLDRLVAVHLAEGIVGDRYRLHDLLRVYAAERAVQEESKAERTVAIRRMLDWYLDTAYAANHVLAPQRHDPVLSPSEFDLPARSFGSYDEALAWCEREMPNLVAATHTAVDAGQYATSWQLPVGCWNYLYLRKRWSSWISAHEAGLVGARAAGDKFGEAWVMNNLAHAHRELRHFDEAHDLLARTLAIRVDIDDLVGEAWTLAAFGLLATDQGDHAEGARRFQQALAVRADIETRYADDTAISVANRHGEGITLANLGNAYRELHHADKALACLGESLAIFREIDDPHGEGYTLVKLGDTYQDLARTDQALNAYREALATRKGIGDRWGEAETLHKTGQLLLDTGDRDTAISYWREAVAIFAELGDPRAEDLRAQLAFVTG
ncbi:MAG TPA: tetratricopeptide repeat protein [Pseudonocardiaceae bacterium]|jgi:tetratricopeptide (TPR) repeat protein/transcriptional regulator with XRE-family HTH domain|nr:tetratricopeptide repeat protein [Pseudonocardiaceae bacterium]